jgi:hypothetical protein
VCRFCEVPSAVVVKPAPYVYLSELRRLRACCEEDQAFAELMLAYGRCFSFADAPHLYVAPYIWNIPVSGVL